jgi:hypothetical protein
LSVVAATIEHMIDTQVSPQTLDPSTLLTLSADNVDETEALQAIEAIIQAQAMLDAVRLTFVNRYATLHGDHKFAQKALADRQKVSTAQAGSDISLAYALTTRLPHTFDNLAEGAMNYTKATQIARATAVLALEKTLEIDAALYPVACEKTPRQLSELLRHLIGQAAPEAAADRAKKHKPGHRISLGRKVEKSWLHVFMASDDVRAIERRLNLIAECLLQTGDERTLNELRADTVRDLLLGRFPSEAIKQVYLEPGATAPENIPEQRRSSGALPTETVRELGRWFRAAWSGEPLEDNNAPGPGAGPDKTQGA